MIKLTFPKNQILSVSSFHELVSTPFKGQVNAISWKRKLRGDFAEIVDKVALNGNIMVLNEDELLGLSLTEEGELARNTILNDLKLLKAHGASPILNVIKNYERDDFFPFFPTDVYSYHVDRSPIETDTFLCTYHGEPSELLLNDQAIQKVLIPEIRNELLNTYGKLDAGFESFLTENFFDLHYNPIPNAIPISLGVGNMWRLAVDYPEGPVLPCIHRAPIEKNDQKRLLIIC